MSAKEYLWEKKGEPDDETRELEALLGQAKFSGMKASTVHPERSRGSRGRWLGLAVLAAAAVAVFLMVPREGFVMLHGIDGVARKLYPAQWLESEAKATLELGASIGHLEVAAGSKLRVTRMDRTEQRLELARGSVHAVVLAPPRLFVIDTPSATAVDLGCEYTLDVNAEGGSRLQVLSGRVELEGHGRRALVPAGMWSVTHPGQGPSVPIDRNATPALISAVERLEQDPSLMTMLLRQADRHDAVTLWHLLPRTEGEARKAVYSRLQELVPAPVDEVAVLALDPVALDEWWRACLAARD